VAKFVNKFTDKATCRVNKPIAYLGKSLNLTMLLLQGAHEKNCVVNTDSMNLYCCQLQRTPRHLPDSFL
jgi:hypothetical protein